MQYNEHLPHNYSYRDFVQFATPEELEKELLGRLTDLLHGGGFDDDWGLEFLKNGNLKFRIGHHNMDENGYYDGWHYCNVYVSKCCLNILRYTFTATKYTRRKYLWDDGDYFTQAINDAFHALRDSFPTRTEYAPYDKLKESETFVDSGHGSFQLFDKQESPQLSSLLVTKEIKEHKQEREESISFLSKLFPKLFPTPKERSINRSLY